MRLPLRSRLTLLFVALAAVVVAIASIALVLLFRAELRGSVDERLAARFASLEADPRAAAAGTATEDEFVQLLVPDGTLVTGRGPTEELVPASVTDRLEGRRFFSRDVPTLEEVVPMRILAGPVEDGVLMVAADVEDQAEAVLRLTTILALGGPVLVLVIGGLGWVLAGAALRPVERLRAEAATIHTLEPSRRLAVPETADELQRLAETLNEMLDRVHEALDRERAFVDEASHELRTPLGVLQAEIDLALREPRSRAELEAALRSIAQETTRLRRLTQDLLVLARSDRGRLALHRTDADVSSIVDLVLGTFADRAAADGVRLRTEGGPLPARVDVDRLRQAIENLVDNALRHTGEGDEIEVRAERRDGRLRLTVTDSGPGFPAGFLERATEPFARADGERHLSGAGLGLTIVRAVAEAHGGSLSIENRPNGGASVTIELPT